MLTTLKSDTLSLLRQRGKGSPGQRTAKPLLSISLFRGQYTIECLGYDYRIFYSGTRGGLSSESRVTVGLALSGTLWMLRRSQLFPLIDRFSMLVSGDEERWLSR